METKEIKINCPEGFEIDKENSTFECIKFKPINKELPKTWGEFCKKYPIKSEECYINGCSSISKYFGKERNPNKDKNLLPSKELAEAILALCQLIQLREVYNCGWQPDWTNDSERKYVIVLCKDEFIQDDYYTHNRILVFRTQELCNQFFENFKDLIKIAKPLL